jgi:hypothetical protein
MELETIAASMQQQVDDLRWHLQALIATNEKLRASAGLEPLTI